MLPLCKVWKTALFRCSKTITCCKKFQTSSRNESISIFDRNTKLLQRKRASSAEDADLYDYLKEEIGYRLADRVFDIKKKFLLAADLGCSRGYVSKHISKSSIDQIILCDTNTSNLEAASSTIEEGILVKKMVLDEENIEFEPNTLDLVISSLALHWVNDLPKAFKQIHRALKEDGVLLASVFGGDTLYELRSSLQLAELERQGGISPHISPFTEVRDVGALLTNAGFSMLTIDTDEIIVNYPTMFELMWDLKGMAESNAAFNRSIHLHRDTQVAAAAIYQELYQKVDPETHKTTVPATFQVINMLGWKPSSNPSKPMKNKFGINEGYSKENGIVKETKTSQDDSR